ncbi:MAG: hypothetical protein WBL57_00010 [Methylovirgula sp.]
MPCVEINEAAAPAIMVAEKVRLFIIMFVLLEWGWSIEPASSTFPASAQYRDDGAMLII